jgi:hypothetical protein
MYDMELGITSSPFIFLAAHKQSSPPVTLYDALFDSFVHVYQLE